MEKLLENTFDLFIAYHGTNDPNGSLLKATEIYRMLSTKIKCFFNPITNAGGQFGNTPIVASHSKLFLLVANQHINTNVFGEISSPGLYREIEAFYQSNFSDLTSAGKARVYAFNGLTASASDHLHILFRTTEHFEEEKEPNSFSKLIHWICASLKLADDTFENPNLHTADLPTMHLSETNAFTFSQKFLHSGALKLKDKSIDEIDQELHKFSELYRPISTLYRRSQQLEVFDLSESIFQIIQESLTNPLDENLLKIKGPLGCYKNRLMQYIYLKLSKLDSDILPFYLDVSMYEKFREKTINSSEISLDDAVRNDFSVLRYLIENCYDKTPLIILDGIRDFSSGKDYLYAYIDSQLANLPCKKIVSLDTDFTVNPQRKFRVHPLAPMTFIYFIRITSMPLYRKTESIRFLLQCIEMFQIPIDSTLTAEKVYNRLIRLDLLSMDAYWMDKLLTSLIDNLLREDMTVADLYNAVCLKFLPDSKAIDSAAEIAYNYEFGLMDFDNNDFFFDNRWKLIRKHRSVLDYLIARHYVNIFSKINIQEKNFTDWKESLKFFNMVLPKNITRFVVTMLNVADDYEEKVLMLAKNHYQDLLLFGKSELTFWLGRLKNPLRKEEGAQLLHLFYREQIESYKNSQIFHLSNDVRKEAFLLRGISVSLIYYGDREILNEYLDSLLNDKICNSINRGFHLEYYGDKLYIPNRSLLDFEDDLGKGEKTCNTLCLALEKRMGGAKFNEIAVLELMTLCNLIQARVEYSNSEHVFDTTAYFAKCKTYLDWILKQRVVATYKKTYFYFVWMQNELDHLLLQKEQFLDLMTGLYDKYSLARSVVRTGWKLRNIPLPENIVEHMYNCWLMGLLYLPDVSDQEGYDKSVILNMLLIHDLGETETGDIPRPDKQSNPSFYDKQEDQIMRALFLCGTYPSAPNLNNYYDYWDQWHSNSDINAQIAKDIDNIQAIYQFCKYNILFPNLFTTKDIRNWLNGLGEIGTEVGRQISERLLEKNPNFSDLFKKWMAE